MYHFRKQQTLPGIMHHRVWAIQGTSGQSIPEHKWGQWKKSGVQLMTFPVYAPVLFHNLDIKHLVNNVSNTSSHFHLQQLLLNTHCVSRIIKQQMNSEIAADVVSFTALQPFLQHLSISRWCWCDFPVLYSETMFTCLRNYTIGNYTPSLASEYNLLIILPLV